MRLFRPIWFVSLLVATGCGGGSDQAQGHWFRTETGEDGTLVAISSATPKFEEPLIRLVETVRIQSDDEVPESLLYQAWEFEQGPDGDFYVMGRGNSRVAVFGPDGRYLRAFGSAGDGPGEFRSPDLIGVEEDGVWVYEARHRRLMQFSLQGEFLKNYALTGSSESIVGISPQRDRLITRSSGNDRRPDGSMAYWTILKVRTLSGDSLGVVESGKRWMAPPVQVEGVGMIGFPQPYSVGPSIIFQPGRGFLAYDGNRPEFVWYDPLGRIARRIRIQLEQEPLSTELREAYLATLREDVDGADDEQRRNMAQARLSHVDFPDELPFYMSALVDDVGYLWVLPVFDYRLIRDPNASQMVRLLSPEGEYLGDVEIPYGTSRVKHGLLHAMRYNEETGETTLVAYRIESAVPGFVYP